METFFDIDLLENLFRDGEVIQNRLLICYRNGSFSSGKTPKACKSGIGVRTSKEVSKLVSYGSQDLLGTLKELSGVLLHGGEGVLCLFRGLVCRGGCEALGGC